MWSRVVLAPDESAGGGEAAPAAPAVAPAPESLPAPSETVDATATGGQEQTEQAANPVPVAPAPKILDWKDRRMAVLTARLREAEARAKELAGGAKPPGPALPEAEINERAARLAREMEAQREFNRRCDETAEQGRKAFGDQPFSERVNALRQIFDPQDPKQVADYNLMLDAIIETGRGAELVHRLGGDLDEAARLLALTASPVKLGIELAKLAAPRAAPALSAAPKPITPIGSRGAGNEKIDPDDVERADRLSTAEWMRRREAQVAERRNRA